MRLITIVNRYGVLTVEEGRLDDSRREWTAANSIDVYVKGGFTDIEYAQAANLAMNVCLGMNIPAIALKRVVAGKTRVFITEARRMF